MVEEARAHQDGLDHQADAGLDAHLGGADVVDGAQALEVLLGRRPAVGAAGEVGQPSVAAGRDAEVAARARQDVGGGDLREGLGDHRLLLDEEARGHTADVEALGVVVRREGPRAGAVVSPSRSRTVRSNWSRVSRRIGPSGTDATSQRGAAPGGGSPFGSPISPLQAQSTPARANAPSRNALLGVGRDMVRETYATTVPAPPRPLSHRRT